MKKLIFFLIAVSLILPVVSATSGYINNTAGNFVLSATVRLSNATWNASTTSNSSGYWTITLPSNDTYNYTISKNGYVTQTGNQLFNITLTNYNFTLSCFGGLSSCNPPLYNGNAFNLVNYDFFGNAFNLVNFTNIVFAEGSVLRSANHSIGWTFGGTGSAIVAPDNYTIIVPSAGTIKSIEVVSDQLTTTTFNVTKASFPAGGAVPTYSDITGGNQVTLSNVGSLSDTTLTGWTKTLVYHDVLMVNVYSNNNAVELTIQIDYW